MDNSFEGKEVVSAAYRLTFQALRTLWRETILAAIIIGLSVIIRIAPNDPFSSSSGPFALLTKIAEVILLLPYTIAIYRCALRLPLLTIMDSAREAARHKMFFTYNMIWCLWAIIIDHLEYLPDPYYLPASMVVIATTILTALRLSLIGPALAIDCFNVTVDQAYNATAGRVRALFIIGLRTLLPFMTVITIFGTLLTFGYFIIIAIFPDIDLNILCYILRFVFLVPVSLFAVVLYSVLDARVFEALVLSNISDGVV